MTKKTAKAEATKTEIVEAALELFFEKGYENTSIRMIQSKIGREVGSFYYHFSSKDDVMEAAIELFFSSYEGKMQAILADGMNSSEHVLLDYIDYIDEATQNFREQYLTKLHWSILGAIREHTICIMKKYIQQILDFYLETQKIVRPTCGIDVAANMLAFSIGGSILYQSKESYREQRKAVLAIIPLLIGIEG